MLNFVLEVLSNLASQEKIYKYTGKNENLVIFVSDMLVHTEDPKKSMRNYEDY